MNVNPPSMDKTVDEAASQSLAKQGKLATALGAVMVNDLKKLSEDERETVRRYREQKVFTGQPTKPADGGDLIVADDMHINLPAQQQSQSPLVPALLGAVLATLLGGGAWLATRPAAPVTQQAPADSEYEIRFYDAQGRPIDVPHIKTRPK